MPLWREHHPFLLIQNLTCRRLESFLINAGLPIIPTITSEGAFFLPPVGVSSSDVRTFAPVHQHREIVNASMLSDCIAQADLCHAAVTDAELLTIPHIFWPVTCFWKNGLQCFSSCHSDLRAHIGSALFYLSWLKSEEWLNWRVQEKSLQGLTAIQTRDGKSTINPPKYNVAIGNSVPAASL